MSKSHLLSSSKIYRLRRGIKTRCEDFNFHAYKNYWGRGIKCLRKSFQEFYIDMWSTYKEWLWIDRIDNNWNYCKENCRWVDQETQQNNRRDNVKYKWLSISQRERKLWTKCWTIHARLKKWWSREESVWEVKRKEKRWIVISWNAKKIWLIESGKIIKVRDSINSAAKELWLSHSSIWYVCEWKYKQAKWMVFTYIK